MLLYILYLVVGLIVLILLVAAVAKKEYALVSEIIIHKSKDCSKKILAKDMNDTAQNLKQVLEKQ